MPFTPGAALWQALHTAKAAGTATAAVVALGLGVGLAVAAGVGSTVELGTGAEVSPGVGPIAWPPGVSVAAAEVGATSSVGSAASPHPATANNSTSAAADFGANFISGLSQQAA
jgi:hypothetical protein